MLWNTCIQSNGSKNRPSLHEGNAAGDDGETAADQVMAPSE